MNNPLSLDVTEVMRKSGGYETIETEGAAPVRIGPEMIAIKEGDQISVYATITNVGEGLIVSAEINGRAHGECVRCLAPLDPEVTFTIDDVWALSEDFIVQESDGDSKDEEATPSMVQDGRIDLTQALIDEAGVTLPFSPTCDQFDQECDETTPEPDGISGEEELIDPRWAGLMDKFNSES